MADKFYTYSKLTHFGNVFDSGRFKKDIEDSDVERSLRGIGTNGDQIVVTFKGSNDLSTPDLNLLEGASFPSPVGGLIAAHTGTPIPSEATLVRQEFHEDEHRAQVDGHVITGEADEWNYQDYSMPADLHLNESIVFFDGFKLGDYAFPVVINPAGDCDLDQGEAQGATVIRLPVGKALWYQPSFGAAHLELWNSAMDELLEVHPIIAADPGPDTVTLASGLVAVRDDTVKARVRYGSFSPPRGAAGIEGGLFGLGTGRFALRQPYSMTAVLPAGTVISARMKTTSEVGTRKLACVYIFRTS